MSAESFSNYLQRVKKVVAIKSDGIQIAALKGLEGSFKTRIFNNGKASDGKGIGKYSKSYAIKRRKRGLQTAYVDQQFEGNLLRSIQVGKSQGKNVMGFINTLQKNIAEDNQRRFKKQIYKVSQQEAKDIRDTWAFQLRKVIRNV